MKLREDLIPDHLRTWAEIDLAALRHNLAYAKRLAGQDRQVMAVLKANAYGHGLVRIARALEPEGLPFFGLANAAEARRLHKHGIQTRLYLLGSTFPAEREEIVAHDWVPFLSDLEEARHYNTLAAQQKKRLRVHLAIDTGMGRGGFLAEHLSTSLDALLALPHLLIEGFASHLSSADEDPEFTHLQFTNFERSLLQVQERLALQWIHLSNSAGLLAYGPGPCNLFRPGLMLYGISPMPEHGSELIPVMSLMSRISIVREVPAGHAISYGHAYRTPHRMRIGTVGAGYGDGYPRSVSERGAQVRVGDQLCPVLGRVTMDQIVVDLTAAPQVTAGMPVEIFGRHVSCAEVAERAGTIAWEVLTGITPRVKRILID